MAKTANQSPKRSRPSPRSGQTLPLGNHPGNTGGKKGRSGPKTNEFKEFCRTGLMDEKVQESMLKAARRGDLNAINTMAKYSQKLPSVDHDLSFKRPVEFTIKIPRRDDGD